MEISDNGTALQWQDGGGVLASGRLHTDLLVDPFAALQRVGGNLPGQRCRFDSVRIGQRSWRYSMLVRDEAVEKMFVEPHKPGDPIEVSDADTMLDYLNLYAKKPDQVVIFTREVCQFCAEAKTNLKKAGYAYVEVPHANQIRSRVVGALAGQGTVPQIFINGEYVGGSDALKRYLVKCQAA